MYEHAIFLSTYLIAYCSKNNCHVNATCTDTINSYICNCHKGFQGNGMNCAGMTFIFYYLLVCILPVRAEIRPHLSSYSFTINPSPMFAIRNALVFSYIWTKIPRLLLVVKRIEDQFVEKSPNFSKFRLRRSEVYFDKPIFRIMTKMLSFF